MAFAYVFMMQALISVFINWASMHVTLNATGEQGQVTTIDKIGAVIFILGFVMETVADWQLQSFRDNPKRVSGSIITSGLWRYSRHPNYFGEALLWWGLFVMTCSLPRGFVYFFSPLLITLLLRYVSGVPLLERHFAKNPAFQHYMKETSIFVPWFPKIVKRSN